MSMERSTPCDHEWAQIYVKETWSGQLRLSGCCDCRAILREWIPVTSPKDDARAGDVVSQRRRGRYSDAR